MASVVWDIGQEHRSIGEDLNRFLFVDGKPSKNKPAEHTKEELEEMLERVRQRCWAAYDEIKNEYGWGE